MTQQYLTTEQLAARIQYEPRTIRTKLKDTVLIEGQHYFRPFGGRKILYIWEVIERDMRAASMASSIAMPVAASVGIGRG